ncbi:PQQ-dependent sugar dehydrogenase [Alloalcanivorax mobilis]|uniref:PQQ-dependent sugar dehydrogenase n=1 Tax=Alloalcanivorax mobilis TaxID=2019569 RepID=UPI000C790C0C|nr:PQQ-dependent sugar dehydrogenase [Alloalcanivorax mobilis]
MHWKKPDTRAPRRAPATIKALVAAAGLLAACGHAETRLDTLNVEKGFSVSVFADQVPNARQLAQAADGTVFAGSRDAGKVYAIRDTDGDGKADRVTALLEDLNMPSGIALRDGTLYVAAVNRILAVRDVLNHLDGADAEVVYDGFPDASHHGWKYLRFDDHGKLIVPVGAPCNICDEDPPFASIQRLDPDTGTTETLARGVRNSVGFDFQPGTGQLWFTENGRDMLGDNVPPDELNRVTRVGEHFGYPYVHAGDIADPEFGKGKNASDYTAPMQKIPAHHAALGMTFYDADSFPAAYRGNIFIAEHGSWNRTEPAGYRVTRVVLNEDGTVKSYQPFIDGWLQDGASWGRPADVLVANDGSLLIADDSAGVIYRVRYAE